MTRNVLLGAVLGLAVALLLSPIIAAFRDQLGQIAMAAVGGAVVWWWEQRGTTTR